MVVVVLCVLWVLHWHELLYLLLRHWALQSPSLPAQWLPFRMFAVGTAFVTS